MLIYGAYGSGKTFLAGTANDVPEMRDVLMLDVEAGDATVRRWPGMGVVRVDNSYAMVARFVEYLRAHATLRERGDLVKLAEMESRLRGSAVTPQTVKQWKTVIVDSLSEVHKLAMYQLLGIRVDRAQLDVEPGTPEFRHWGNASEMVRLLIRSLRDLPMHVVFVCSEREVEDERKRLNKRPNLAGQLSGDVQGFMDIVGYLKASPADEEGVVQRRLYLAEGPDWKAKSRIPEITARHVDNPKMADLMAPILKGSKLS